MSNNFLNVFGIGDPLDLEIEELEFWPQTQHRLKDAGIHTLRALVQLDKAKLRAAGLSLKMIEEIHATLDAIGLRLGM